MSSSTGASASSRSVSKSATGFVGFVECDNDGRFISLENTHRGKDENMDGWTIKRTIDNKSEVVFTFPPNYVLKGAQTVTIWANTDSRDDPPEHLVLDAPSWGSGDHSRTILYSNHGIEKATYIKRSAGPDLKNAESQRAGHI